MNKNVFDEYNNMKKFKKTIKYVYTNHSQLLFSSIDCCLKNNYTCTFITSTPYLADDTGTIQVRTPSSISIAWNKSKKIHKYSNPYDVLKRFCVMKDDKIVFPLTLKITMPSATDNSVGIHFDIDNVSEFLDEWKEINPEVFV